MDEKLGKTIREAHRYGVTPVKQLTFDEAEELGLDGTLRTTGGEPHVIDECQLCGEGLEVDQFGMYASHEEVGEFWDAEKNTSVVAHAQCGLDAELPLA